MAARRFAPYVRPALVNGSAGVVAFDDDKPFAILAFTVVDGSAIAIDIFNDPELVPRLLLQRASSAPSATRVSTFTELGRSVRWAPAVAQNCALGERRLDLSLEPLLRVGARHALDLLAVLENDQGRDREHVVLDRGLLILVGVDLGDLELTGLLVGDLLDDRARPCGTARTKEPRSRRAPARQTPAPRPGSCCLLLRKRSPPCWLL